MRGTLVLGTLLSERQAKGLAVVEHALWKVVVRS
jgi:hypothetical protein